jgi:hypothetical protein
MRHYGLFANDGRADNIARARQLLNLRAARVEPGDTAAPVRLSPDALASLPLLRSAHNHHRDFRPRMQAATPLHGPGLDPDRQLMIATDWSTPLNAAHPRRLCRGKAHRASGATPAAGCRSPVGTAEIFSATTARQIAGHAGICRETVAAILPFVDDIDAVRVGGLELRS